MEEDALNYFAQVATEFRRLGITPADEERRSVEFALPAGEYLSLLRALPDGAGLPALEAQLRDLLPPEFKGAWDRPRRPGAPGA